MKVLIVNGYSPGSEGQRSFLRFEAAIKEVLFLQCFRQQKCFTIEEIEFEVADYHSLDMYLYEMNSGFLNKDSEKVRFKQLFDHLDMVFIDGEALNLPWFQRMRKVSGRQYLILMRMCKKTGKVLFGCGFAMQTLAFLCATNIFVNRIVNGNGKGSLLKNFKSVPKSVLKQTEHGDLFLDSATGDLYAYDQIKEEFYPIANCAIHNHKAAQEDRTTYTAQARSCMLKSYRYIPQNFESTERIFISSINESKCRILKQYIQHWLSSGLGVRCI